MITVLSKRPNWTKRPKLLDVNKNNCQHECQCQKCVALSIFFVLLCIGMLREAYSLI